MNPEWMRACGNITWEKTAAVTDPDSQMLPARNLNGLSQEIDLFREIMVESVLVNLDSLVPHLSPQSGSGSRDRAVAGGLFRAWDAIGAPCGAPKELGGCLSIANFPITSPNFDAPLALLRALQWSAVPSPSPPRPLPVPSPSPIPSPIPSPSPSTGFWPRASASTFSPPGSPPNSTSYRSFEPGSG